MVAVVWRRFNCIDPMPADNAFTLEEMVLINALATSPADSALLTILDNAWCSALRLLNRVSNEVALAFTDPKLTDTVLACPSADVAASLAVFACVSAADTANDKAAIDSVRLLTVSDKFLSATLICDTLFDKTLLAEKWSEKK